MLDNTKIPLFKTIEEEVKTYDRKYNEEIDIDESLDTIMGEVDRGC